MGEKVMPKTRKAFYEALAYALMNSNGDNMHTLLLFAETVPIEDNHDVLVAIIEGRMQVLSYWKKELEEIKQVVLEQKAEAVKRAAEKAKSVNEDARHNAILDLRQRMRITLRELANDGQRFFATFDLYADVLLSLKGAKTEEEFQRVKSASKQLG
jgi:hypothetical protein